LGVVPKALAKGDIIGKTIREELQVSTMSDRMTPMFNHVDAFIALLGGLGTLEEIFHISSLAQLNINYKPIARQIIISAATTEQLIDELQSFIPVVDSSMSRINWSITKCRKKLRLDLSLSLSKLVSFGFIHSILFVFCCFLYLFMCVLGLSMFFVSGDVFYTLSFYLRTLRTMSRFGWRERVVVDIKRKIN